MLHFQIYCAEDRITKNAEYNSLLENLDKLELNSNIYGLVPVKDNSTRWHPVRTANGSFFSNMAINKDSRTIEEQITLLKTNRSPPFESLEPQYGNPYHITQKPAQFVVETDNCFNTREYSKT